MHVLFEQVSFVHRFESLQRIARAAALFCLTPHPDTGLQKDSKQMSFGAGHVIGVYTQALPEHVSVVHALLSLHKAAISDAFFGSVTQPVEGKQVAFAQMSAGGEHVTGE